MRAWMLPAMAIALVLWPHPVLARGPFEVVKVDNGMYHGPAPHCPEDYQLLQDMGIKTILEMRKFLPRQISTEQCMAERYGFRYVQIPLGFRRDLDCILLRTLAVVTDPEQQPIYFHCNLGRDRVNLVEALYRVRYQGWSPQRAFCAMRQAGFKRFLRKLENAYWRLACPWADAPRTPSAAAGDDPPPATVSPPSNGSPSTVPGEPTPAEER